MLPSDHNSPLSKPAIRKALRESLAAMTDAERAERSATACANLCDCIEFARANVVMLYLSTPTEVDTAALALKAWQMGATVAVPKVSWDQRHMMAIEITSLHAGITTTRPGLREPEAGNPIPLDMIDLVVVPGLGFTATGHRIGHGMGFYDRFLSQPDFKGVSCGLAFETQVVAELPMADHDIPLQMLVTDTTVRRFQPRFA